MDDNVKQAIQLLVDQGYLELVGKKYRLTPKLNVGDNGLMVASSKAMQPRTQQDWEELYINFITAAEVPRRCESTDGTLYDTNKYSEEGMKAFKKMMQDGIQAPVLIAATKLYYAGRSKLKMKIGNYIAKGEWRSDYFRLLDSANQGETELRNHLNEELNGPEAFTRDQLG